jgi:hypothetical protein
VEVAFFVTFIALLSRLIASLLANPVQQEDDPLFDVFAQLWPLFSATLQARVDDNEAVQVCSRVIRYGARALPPHQMAQVAPDVFQLIADCFDRNPTGELLHVVGSLVGSLVGVPMLEPAAPVLTKAFAFMGNAELLNGFPDVAQEVFMIGTSLLWSTPVPFVTSAYLGAYLERAIVALQCDNPDVARSVFAFLSELLTMAVPRGRSSSRITAEHANTDDDSELVRQQQIVPAVREALAGSCAPLIDALLTGLAGALPLRFVTEVAGTLRRLRRLDAAAASSALVSLLQTRLPNLDNSHKEALATAMQNSNDNLFHACDAFATACRRRKRWIVSPLWCNTHCLSDIYLILFSIETAARAAVTDEPH